MTHKLVIEKKLYELYKLKLKIQELEETQDKLINKSKILKTQIRTLGQSIGTLKRQLMDDIQI